MNIHIANNLRYLRKKNKISQGELADQLQVGRTTFGDYERGKTEPNLDMLTTLSTLFDVSIHDLITRDLSKDQYVVAQSPGMKVLAITVDAEQNGNIELVDTKAEAGYLDSFNDPEYIRELPKISFPKIPEGTFRGFEIRGDSMLPIESGSVIICQYVEKLQDIKDNRTYVVVSRDQGLAYKRVIKDLSQNRLLLQSDNEAYLPYHIDVQEISEIWQYYAHVSFSDSKQTFNAMLDEKLNDLQKKVTEIHKKVC